ncbi:Gfo/Idh/MocA family oxidoreductase [Martelella sp. AD-3]|uniref:Gfo/Idh/MocA family protein n=1 Tax=Martelella sp. AD-3 TaxID=686597 RepID=UPI0004638072|nr:Gfo/Idh/MocA family oxidoreductase [Martelella sp. AD-3]AMM87263.1 oxidoreductase [Martelella sp. AD-3]
MTLRVGVVGCGNISDIYFSNSVLFKDFTITAASDLRMEAAHEKAQKYNVKAVAVDELLRRDDIDAILNLTIPAAHADIALRALDAGKHVYGEKPLATSRAEGEAVVKLAKEKGLYVGSAPDTILGPGIQTANTLIEQGVTGKVITGTAAVMSRGMEHWHPNPAFFFSFGGGPVLDMGPYYIASLVALLGPVKRVSASGKIGHATRTVTAEGAQKGQVICVEALTTVTAILSFESGADIILLASWDVWAHSLPAIEIHGADCSLSIPDSNFFGGNIMQSTDRKIWGKTIETVGLPLGGINYPADAPLHANHRGIGLAEMARAISEKRTNRLDGEFALHCLDVLLAIVESATENRPAEIVHHCERPASLGIAEARQLLV